MKRRSDEPSEKNRKRKNGAENMPPLPDNNGEPGEERTHSCLKQPENGSSENHTFPGAWERVIERSGVRE